MRTSLNLCIMDTLGPVAKWPDDQVCKLYRCPYFQPSIFARSSNSQILHVKYSYKVSDFILKDFKINNLIGDKALICVDENVSRLFKCYIICI